MDSEVGMWSIRDDSVSMERLDGETILINFETGQYFSFRGPSADILWLVQAGVDPMHWPATLGESFEHFSWTDQVQTSIIDFLDSLSELGVISAITEMHGASVALPDDYVRTEWTAPSVFANDDLADLLVIDPIHDASEDGWPQS